MIDVCVFWRKITGHQIIHYLILSVSVDTILTFLFVNADRLLKIGLYMLTFTHCIACIWFLLACNGLENGEHFCLEDSWVEQEGRKLGRLSLEIIALFLYLTLNRGLCLKISLFLGVAVAIHGWCV